MTDPSNSLNQAAGLATSITRTFADRLPDKAKKYLGYVVAAHTMWEIGSRAVTMVKGRVAHTIAVASSDDIYPDIHRWLLDRMEPRRRRALNVGTIRFRDQPFDTAVADDTVEEDRSHLVMFYDGTREQTIDIGGHRVRVALEKPEHDWVKWARDESYQSRQTERIVFTAFGVAAREAVLEFLGEIARERHRSANRSPNFYVAGHYGGFNRRKDIPRRPLDSVILRAGQADVILTDMAEFLRCEDDYGDLGIPWHRGYLFHGPPGTGKTSVAKALATEFNLDVYYIPLADLDKDANLLGLVAEISNGGGMLLLEDVDVFHAATSRDDGDKPAVTLSGLLNALDGVSTPHGLITVMTTNNLDALDPALLRPGRVDRLMEVGLLDDDQLGRLVEMFLGRRAVLPRLACPLAPADVIEVMKRHMGDRSAAITEIAALVRGDVKAVA